ncbi:hypothetical protein [Microbispora rosea]|uniref:hypothetical protein n=1 Tax=Microbispora rosea TaxID=58117 RepID=UPI003433DF08
MFALIGALGGVAISGTIGIVTAVLTHRWQTQATDRNLLREHTKQLRQERREIYAQYWAAWNALMRTLDNLHEDPTNSEIRARVTTAESRWLEAVDALLLICGQEVLDTCLQHLRVTKERIAATRHGNRLSGEGRSVALNKAMRKDIINPESIGLIEVTKDARHPTASTPRKATT